MGRFQEVPEPVPTSPKETGSQFPSPPPKGVGTGGTCFRNCENPEPRGGGRPDASWNRSVTPAG